MDTKEVWLPFCPLNLRKSSNQEIQKGTIKQSSNFYDKNLASLFTKTSTGDVLVTTLVNKCVVSRGQTLFRTKGKSWSHGHTATCHQRI